MLAKKLIVAAAVAAAALAGAAGANAKTLVSTISGGYDLGGCCSGPQYDTPTLVINNTSGGDFVNATMELIGYQGDNIGQTLTINLGTIANGTSDTLNWGQLPGVSGSTSAFNLAAYDYDDEFFGTSEIIPNPTCGAGCVPGGSPVYYAQVGNFRVVFSATVSGGTFNGQPVNANFTPSFNATGHFVGWEGLDSNGYSEQICCDVHSGQITGDLANIYLGKATVPEPATWAMLIAGAAGIGASLRGRRKLATA